MENIVTFTQGKTRTYISSPYDEEFITEIKKIDGRWDSARKAWHIANKDIDRAKELTLKIFGSDGTPATETDRVTVRLNMEEYKECRSVTLGGREIAKRWQRDEPVKLGKDVILISGNFAPRGGSRAYPKIAENNVVLEIRNFLRSCAEKYGLEILAEETERKEVLKAKKESLLIELAKINEELAAL